MKTLKNTRQIVIKGFLLLMLCFAFLGCKKYFDPPDVFEEQTIVNLKRKKVMLIVIDGVTGSDLQAIAPPKITAMLNNSKYSWSGYSDYVVSDGTAWKNIMTGVAVGKHGVSDNTFDPKVGGAGNEHDAQTAWPTFIERLQASGKMRRSATVTPWKQLSDKLLIYADQPIVANNDQAVKDTVLKKLNTGNEDLLVVNFNEVSKAGVTYGFSPSITEYSNAIKKVDEYIGALLDAMKARKTYKQEDWLVIVTSSHGGTGNSYGEVANRDRERNVFNLYYSDDFKSHEFKSQPFMDGLKFSANAITARLAAADAATYNLGLTGEYTIEFKLRINAFGTLNSTIFFKANSPANSSSGWWFIHNGSDGSWRFVVRRGPSGGANKTLTSKDLTVGRPPLMVTDKWYHLAAKIYEEAGKRYMIIYQDGVKASNALEITGENIINNEDLWAGFKSGYGNVTNQTIADIRFWNTALPDAKILENACLNSITSSDQYYRNLIGYWPGNDGLSAFKNYSPLAIDKDLKLAGSYSWEPHVMPTCGNEIPIPADQVLLRNSDIAAQIYYWYGVAIDDKWNVDGKIFLSKFESEFIK